MRIRAESARVLITVKATPQPSEKYGDTVCVAGVRLDGGSPTLIRLYPIAFRWLGDGAQFDKYDVIDLEIRRRDADTRPESYSPTENSWTRVDSLPPWKRRHEVIRKIEPTTTCELMRRASANSAATSLGLVYPQDVGELEFEPHPKWTREQIAKMESRIARESGALIPMSGAVPAILREPRLKVRYRYRCADRTCGGHQGRILDWELTALQNRLARDSIEVLQRKIEVKFRNQMLGPDRDTAFFMGNFEAAPRRGKFSVLGVYSPRRTDTIPEAPTLF